MSRNDKTATITFHNSYNCGSMLQALALQKVLIDKYGVDVDDIHNIEDILSNKFKSLYRLKITKTNVISEDEKHIGYLKLDKISV